MKRSVDMNMWKVAGEDSNWRSVQRTVQVFADSWSSVVLRVVFCHHV